MILTGFTIAILIILLRCFLPHHFLQSSLVPQNNAIKLSNCTAIIKVDMGMPNLRKGRRKKTRKTFG